MVPQSEIFCSLQEVTGKPWRLSVKNTWSQEILFEKVLDLGARQLKFSCKAIHIQVAQQLCGKSIHTCDNFTCTSRILR
jgi:hypothetical protein